MTPEKDNRANVMIGLIVFAYSDAALAYTSDKMTVVTDHSEY